VVTVSASFSLQKVPFTKETSPGFKITHQYASSSCFLPFLPLVLGGIVVDSDDLAVHFNLRISQRSEFEFSSKMQARWNYVYVVLRFLNFFSARTHHHLNKNPYATATKTSLNKTTGNTINLAGKLGSARFPLRGN
jgi:hypothetical protein